MDTARFFLHVIAQVYNYTLAASVIYALLCFRKRDKGTRFICMFIWLGALSETVAWFSILRFKTNLPVYAVSSIIEFIIICFYFNATLAYFRKWNIGIWSAAIGTLFGILNSALLQPMNTINVNFLFFECLAIVCLSLFSIYQRLMAGDISLTKETHYWIPCILLFYKCSALWNWGTYDYVLSRDPGKTIYLNIGILTINTATYLAFTLLLFFYPKMQRTNV